MRWSAVRYKISQVVIAPRKVSFIGGIVRWSKIHLSFRHSNLSHDWLFTWFVCLFVCCQSFASFSSFGQPLRYADKRIVNIMKVYIERTNLQVELIRFHNFFLFTFAKRRIQCNIAHRTQIGKFRILWLRFWQPKPTRGASFSSFWSLIQMKALSIELSGCDWIAYPGAPRGMLTTQCNYGSYRSRPCVPADTWFSRCSMWL